MIKNYKYNDKTQLTKNINVSALKCKCGGTHDILIDVDHINNIQKFIDINGFNKIIVSSGYRCIKHDKRVGGSGSGPHTKGIAIDCCFYKNGCIVPAKEICCLAQDFGFKGIGYIDKNYVHLDNRQNGIYRGDETKGYSNNVGNDFYKYFNAITCESNYTESFPTLPRRGYFKNGDKGEQVKLLQKFLNWAINVKLSVDGIIGPKTIAAVKEFQSKVVIKTDGLFGKNSLTKARNYTK